MSHPTRGSSFDAVVAVLELVASGRPEMLEFQLETLLNSPMGFAVHDLASDLDVPWERVSFTLYRACLDLDRLEKRRGAWRDPEKILQSPNIAALRHVCRARQGRVTGVARRRQLDVTLRRLERAHALARSRAWIEDFIGPPAGSRGEARDARS